MIEPGTTDLPHLPHSPRGGDRFEVHITGLDGDGAGTGALDALVGPQRAPRRYVWHVRGAIPGDHLAMEADGSGRGDVWGRVVDVITPSPDRVTPPCPHFGRGPGDRPVCGGCTLQALPYAMQLAAKHDRVRRCLNGSGLREPPMLPIVAAPSTLNYRNKMEFSFGHEGGRLVLGLHPPGMRYEILALDQCRLPHPLTAAVLPRVAERLGAMGLMPHNERTGAGWLRNLTVRDALHTGQRLVELTVGGAERVVIDGQERGFDDALAEIGRVLADVFGHAGARVDSMWGSRHLAAPRTPTRLESTLLMGEPVIREELHLAGDPALSLEIHPRAFFQPNTAQAERLYALVRDACVELGDPTNLHALDLYCGTGTIGLCLARRVGRVTGIELVAEAVDNARRNARYNGVDNAEFIAGDVGRVLAERGLDRPGAADVVVVDPPRGGLSPDAVERVATIGARRIVYVSCNPLSLGRDMALLRRSGYAAQRVAPVDLFPQTAHVETVAVLDRVVG